MWVILTRSLRGSVLSSLVVCVAPDGDNKKSLVHVDFSSCGGMEDRVTVLVSIKERK